MPFVVVGTWNGQVQYQEIINDDSLREKYNALNSIQFTDGTVLYLETYDLLKPPQKLGYKLLLDRTIAQGKSGYISVKDIR